ncbi:MAG: hypothetical protein ACLFUS_08625 [Candidatus Sumerlaeia bacterium]
MEAVRFGNKEFSPIILGTNPVNGFSHQNKQRNEEMRGYFTDEKARQLMHEAEALGVDSVVARSDERTLALMQEYWKEGGKIKWIVQISADNGPDSWKPWIERCGDAGASAMFIHGGVVDNWFANETFDNFHEALALMEKHDVARGFAGHKPEAHAWINANLDVDFQMCSWYNPTDRGKNWKHQGEGEVWLPEHREAMFDVIRTISKPVLHYKVFAAANQPIAEAFDLMAGIVQPKDAVCFGIFPKDKPDMLKEDIDLFEDKVGKSAPV